MMCYARKNREKQKAWKNGKLRVAPLSPNFFADYEKARVATNNRVSGWGRGLSVGGFCFRSVANGKRQAKAKIFLSETKKKSRLTAWQKQGL